MVSPADEHERRIERARLYASAGHRATGQVRKYTHEPYINHPARVAALVQSVPHVTEMVMAAWMHDLVEDTEITLGDIEREFGLTVMSYVSGLTNLAQYTDGTREQRFLINLAHLGAQPREVKTIKVADVLDNISTIVQHDPAFARTYLEEKRRVLIALSGANQTLLSQAWETYHRAINDLSKLEPA